MNNYIAQLSQPLIDNYINMETELMLKIADYLKKHGSLITDENVLQWQAMQLMEINGFNDEAIRIIAKYTKSTPAQIRKIVREAVSRGIAKDERIIAMAVESGALQNVVPLAQSGMAALLSQAESSLRTTFNQMANTLLRSAGARYVEVINQVTTQYMAGTVSSTKALSDAVRRLAQLGLDGFIGRNGAAWSPEAYARMTILANAKNAVTAVQDLRYKESGNNYIEINAYAGARPKCSVDQGYVYSLDNDTTPIVDLYGNEIQVKAWGHTSYGQPDGILGINCGHSRWAFVPRFSVQGAENSDINQSENDQKYKESQKQRYYERQIRNAKREKMMLQRSGAPKADVANAQHKISVWQQRTRDFVAKTNGTRYYSRESIFVA